MEVHNGHPLNCASLQVPDPGSVFAPSSFHPRHILYALCDITTFARYNSEFSFPSLDLLVAPSCSDYVCRSHGPGSSASTYSQPSRIPSRHVEGSSWSSKRLEMCRSLSGFNPVPFSTDTNTAPATPHSAANTAHTTSSDQGSQAFLRPSCALSVCL